MSILWASLFVSAVIVFWFSNLLGLPGNWLIVGTACIYAWAVPADTRAGIGWPAVGVVAGLAVLGEIAELAASAAGVKKRGGSWFGAILALVGSVMGAIAGMLVGIPIPIIGPLLAAIVFGGVGAMLGAIVGESIRGQSFDDSVRIGEAAFWGRLLGTLAKATIGAMMVGVVVAAVLIR